MIPRKEAKQTQRVGSQKNKKTVNTDSIGSIVPTESNQTENEIQVISQRIYDAIVNTLKQILGGLENKIAMDITGINSSVK